jgi:hypothetical protein
MKSGQSKLSERESQRSGMFVPPANSEDHDILKIGDYGLK